MNWINLIEETISLASDPTFQSDPYPCELIQMCSDMGYHRIDRRRLINPEAIKKSDIENLAKILVTTAANDSVEVFKDIVFTYIDGTYDHYRSKEEIREDLEEVKLEIKLLELRKRKHQFAATALEKKIQLRMNYIHRLESTLKEFNASTGKTLRNSLRLSIQKASQFIKLYTKPELIKESPTDLAEMFNLEFYLSGRSPDEASMEEMLILVICKTFGFLAFVNEPATLSSIRQALNKGTQSPHWDISASTPGRTLDYRKHYMELFPERT